MFFGFIVPFSKKLHGIFRWIWNEWQSWCFHVSSLQMHTNLVGRCIDFCLIYTFAITYYSMILISKSEQMLTIFVYSICIVTQQQKQKAKAKHYVNEFRERAFMLLMFFFFWCQCVLTKQKKQMKMESQKHTWREFLLRSSEYAEHDRKKTTTHNKRMIKIYKKKMPVARRIQWSANLFLVFVLSHSNAVIK